MVVHCRRVVVDVVVVVVVDVVIIVVVDVCIIVECSIGEGGHFEIGEDVGDGMTMELEEEFGEDAVVTVVKRVVREAWTSAEVDSGGEPGFAAAVVADVNDGIEVDVTTAEVNVVVIVVIVVVVFGRRDNDEKGEEEEEEE